jgi:sucrose-6-phosphate hydrolase SacC (GH32 family)
MFVYSSPPGEAATVTPVTYQMAGIHGGNPMTEPIEMNIFVDGSLVEVFVNDRFALTSCWGIP